MEENSRAHRPLTPENQGESAADEGQWVIRQARQEDLGELYKLEVRAHQAPWPQEAFQEEFQRENAGVWVIDGDNCIAAMVIFWRLFDILEILDVAVAPRYQGLGLATYLMQTLHAVAAASGVTQVNLEVRVSNRPAIGLYEKLGFIRAGRRPNYYEDNGEDAYLMTCHLETT